MSADQEHAPAAQAVHAGALTSQREPGPAPTGTPSSACTAPDQGRTEHDLLGDRLVDADAYIGIHTVRALENFPITGLAIGRHPDLVVALACVKAAAARANNDIGLLDDPAAAAIDHACAEIIGGELHDQFVVDVIQGGAGTSTNMNANEVIANRALELMGRPKGDYTTIHPVEHVNLGQSTNDVYPTAIKVALHLAIRRLHAAQARLADVFLQKADEFGQVLKIGRTQLQDAVPMTLGQEMAAYSTMVADSNERILDASNLLTTVNLGGTAIGTGINAHPRYAAIACEHLRQISGVPVTLAPDPVAATQDTGPFVHLSGTLKRSAVTLSKISSDLRLLSSGPRAGLAEINLPPVQAGSSIMPGKVNPVVPEMVNQVAFEVIGNDLATTLAAESGQLELNAFEPIIVHSLLKSITHLTAACTTLTDHCVRGITADEHRLHETVQRSIGLATVLNPRIGYSAASTIAAEALETGRTIPDMLADTSLLSPAELDEMLTPESLIPSLRPRNAT
ncbi:aspartate ammonia-lyase [Streptosporangium sp. NPDC000509]|uniref:aspartate ammonia-lyase n=1 Tax=Streptosporangium sp. NPDC000509 TaxID=3366186 RepID=UPI0036B3D69D